MQTQQAPAWLSDKDLADRYGVCRITIWRWAKNGVIPPGKKIGPNTTRWSAAEIDARDAEMMNGGEAA
jgi:prophage regulatory protein